MGKVVLEVCPVEELGEEEGLERYDKRRGYCPWKVSAVISCSSDQIHMFRTEVSQKNSSKYSLGSSDCSGCRYLFDGRPRRGGRSTRRRARLQGHRCFRSEADRKNWEERPAKHASPLLSSQTTSDFSFSCYFL